jgi:hypothetical protein
MFSYRPRNGKASEMHMSSCHWCPVGEMLSFGRTMWINTWSVCHPLKYRSDWFTKSPLRHGAWVAQWVRSLDLTAHTSLSPIRHGLAPSFVNYKKGCTRLAATSDKVYQLLAQGQWFSLASSTTLAEILLKMALKHQKSNQIPLKTKLPWQKVRPSHNHEKYTLILFCVLVQLLGFVKFSLYFLICVKIVGISAFQLIHTWDLSCFPRLINWYTPLCYKNNPWWVEINFTWLS